MYCRCIAAENTLTCQPGSQPVRRSLMFKSILIADDQEGVRKVLRSALESAGFVVCAEAVDGLDALEKANRFSPDLIVLDLRMPNMSGIEASSALRNRFPTTPIVLLTMYGAVPAVAAAVGVTVSVDKSDGAANFVECVRKLLAGTPETKPAQVDPSDPEGVKAPETGKT
ncbi:MAG: response regulator transcription factor [Candidatus Acidiferrales bacterium]